MYSKLKEALTPQKPISEYDSFAYLLLLPSLVFMAGYIIYPLIKNLNLSLHSEGYFGAADQFIGFENYISLILDPDFLTVFLNTLYWGFGVTFGSFLFGLVLALLLNRRITKVFRPLVLLPWIVPGVVAAVVFRALYSTYYGPLNAILKRVGLIDSGISWLSGPSWLVLFSIIVLGIWKGFPFFTVMLLAGLQTVPDYLYDAAKIDGASPLQQFWYVTIPQLRPVITVSLILGFIWTIRYFDAIYATTGGGPGFATTTLPIYIYRTGFGTYNFHKGAVLSLTLVVIIFVLAVILRFGLGLKGE